MPSEFELIRRYFTRTPRHTPLGVGDDAALLAPQPGQMLAVSADMLVAGTHFFDQTDPAQVGWKALAVNLSDMAAMGAEPKWATLALALPQADERWIAAFADGFFDCADKFAVDLIGGDTTRGPLCISVQIMGQLPPGQALRRDGARPDDDLWLSGPLGDAALALQQLQGQQALTDAERGEVLPALLRPQPRVALGMALRDVARSAIDISDGLLADLGHLLRASAVGAEILLESIPRSAALQRRLPSARSLLLAGGEDYELCFSAPPQARARIEAIGRRLALPLVRIGHILAQSGLTVRDAAGEPIAIEVTGFDHFAS